MLDVYVIFLLLRDISKASTNNLDIFFTSSLILASMKIPDILPAF